MRQLCERYGIPDVYLDNVSKEDIKEAIWRVGRIEVWEESLKNKRIPFNHSHIKRGELYWKLNKYDSRLIFSYRIGELQFKHYRKGEFMKRFGNTLCFEGCNEPDTLDHVMWCDRYPIRYWGNTKSIDKDYSLIPSFVEYLKRLNDHRAREYGLAVMYQRSLKDMMLQGETADDIVT